MELRYNEPLYNKAFDITIDFSYPSNSKVYGKEPRYNETSLQRTHFASPLALCYIEVPLHCKLTVLYGRTFGTSSFPTRLRSRWGRGEGTPLFGLNGYTLVNRVWLLGSWVFNRVQNFTIFDVLKSVSFWTESLSKSVKVGIKRPTLVLKTIFFEKNLTLWHWF